MLEDYKATLTPEIRSAQARMLALEIKHAAASAERARLIVADMGSDAADELGVVCEMLCDLLKGDDLNGVG